VSDATVVVIIDALGFELAERHGFGLPELPRRARLDTVLGFSQAALASILTGRAPDEHGLWMMYSFAAHASPFAWLALVPSRVSSRRLWLRRLIRWNLEHVRGIKGYYSLYDVPRGILPHLDIPGRKGLFAAGSVPGSTTILDELAARGTPCRVWDYHDEEASAFAALRDDLARGRRGFFLLYTAGLDAELHRAGSAGGGVGERLDWYRARLAEIVAAAETGGGARIFVLGDHGMCDVRARVDLMGEVAALGLDVPRDYVPFYDSTMARLRIRTDRARGVLTQFLGGRAEGRLLGADEMKALGVSFADGRFGDLVFLVEPGTIIAPSFMGSGSVAAMHGYDPDAPCMPSLLLSNAELPRSQMSILDVAGLVVPGFAARSPRRSP
jgi:hypothetical protein